MHQQLTLLVADRAVFGIGFALLRDERVELSIEYFYLWQFLNAMRIEVAFCRAVLLNLVGMGVEEFARIARRLVLVECFARFGVGHNLPAQLSYFRNPGINFLYTVVQSRELFARSVSAGSEFFSSRDAMLLQIQKRLSHLLDVENLSPFGVAAALSRRELGLYVYNKAGFFAFPTRIMRRAPGNDIAQLGLGVSRAERVELDALLPVFVESDAPVFTDPVCWLVYLA